MKIVRPSSSRSGLTLLELLGVMIVSFVLWNLIFQAAEAMGRNGRRRQAEADVHTLANAVLSFRKEYGFFPGQNDDVEGADAWEADIVYRTDDLAEPTPSDVRVLDVSRLFASLSVTNEVDNPRQILFWEENVDRMEEDVFLDPWGDPYVVVVDGNWDGWIGTKEGREISGFDVIEPAFSSAGRTHWVPGLRESVYVFSWGGSATNAIRTAGGM